MHFTIGISPIWGVHEWEARIATDEVAILFQAFDELVDGHVRGLRLGWGLLLLGSGHESDHRREAAVDLAQVTYVPPIDWMFVVARCGKVEQQFADSRYEVLGHKVGVLVGGLGVDLWFGVLGHRLVSVCLEKSLFCTT